MSSRFVCKLQEMELIVKLQVSFPKFSTFLYKRVVRRLLVLLIVVYTAQTQNINFQPGLVTCGNRETALQMFITALGQHYSSLVSTNIVSPEGWEDGHLY